MNKLLLIYCLAFTFGLNANPISKDCKFKGKRLSGRIRIVTANEDFRVKVVNANEDLKVLLQIITWNSRCGEWFYEDANYDFRIRFVGANEDFRIRFVNANAGLN